MPQKLELRKAAALRQEVDAAIGAFQRALDASDAARVEQLRGALAARAEDLEEFFLEHEDDERSLLFEKQRTRLRRALADAAPSAPPPRPVAATTPASNLPPRTPGTADAFPDEGPASPPPTAVADATAPTPGQPDNYSLPSTPTKSPASPKSPAAPL